MLITLQHTSTGTQPFKAFNCHSSNRNKGMKRIQGQITIEEEHEQKKMGRKK
uniref:Xylosyltransferase 1-like n=1 Tax=Rhizophora mucronata TaxID=61149 RepID=A0A2P2IZ14_RHIMU